MRIRTLLVANFKGISRLELRDLADTIVIAGPNGCGKSALFDAIRLWKTAYGGYTRNEIQNWFGEHGLRPGTKDLLNVLQDKNVPMSITAEIEFADAEKEFLKASAESVLRTAAFRRRVPEYALEWNTYGEVSLADNMRIHAQAVAREVEEELPKFMEELGVPSCTGELVCNPDGTTIVTPSILLARAFNIYDPKNIGAFEYHGPQRIFARENVGGINLQIEQYENQRQQSALFNISNKYSTIKSELAAAFVRELISREARSISGDEVESRSESLEDSLKEMFNRFFPDKKFSGVRPNEDGSLSFDVETPAGSHDLNELSSGEKELIYGYLRIRNESPKNSIIMLDEPELHLNPRLTDGLPDFYHRHVGRALNNQLWLVTHSDSILRQSVGQNGYSVFHMLRAGTFDGPSQTVRISEESDLDKAILDLVGDLAAYRPNARIVFIEGDHVTRFDEKMIRRLFPAFADRVNLISAGSKARVKLVHDLLDEARKTGGFPGKIFSIVDADDDLAAEESQKSFKWDRYHIENYLLEEEFILEALRDLPVPAADALTTDDIRLRLKTSAEETLDDLVRHELENESYRTLSAAINVRTDRANFEPENIAIAAKESLQRVQSAVQIKLGATSLRAAAESVTKRRKASLLTDDWKTTFRGRDVLKRFVKREVKVVKYEVFRDLVLARMRLADYQPRGIAEVLEKILET